ncbi:MAG: AAA family ATPase [Acidimicrobiia bacterium]
MTTLAFEDVEIDLDRYEVRRSGDVVPVEPQVFDVLVHLASNAGRVVTKEELLDAVWGDRFVSESALTSRIKAARRAVGDDGRRQRVIATVHGRGYRIVPTVGAARRTAVAAPAGDGASVMTGAEPLVERADAMEQMSSALAAAATGSGRIMCVAGEAGIGKTALVRWMVEAFSRRAVVLVGACDDLATPRPLAPVRDVSDGFRAEGMPLDGDLGGEALLAAARALADERGRPVVIVLEDLHWADDGTLDIVRYVARRIRSSPLLLVLTYREEALQLGHPLRSVLGLLRGPDVSRVALEPLTAEGVADLAAGTALDPHELFAVTGGNPFFVSELLAGGSGAVPQSVRDAVLARLAQLPADAVAALRRLSIVPGRVERWLATELVDGDERSLATAEAAGMLAGTGPHVWFRHELARRAVGETLTSFECLRWHRRAAELLRERTADPSRVMHHAIASDDARLVIEVGPEAAGAAAAAGAHRQAVEHLHEVLRHRESLPRALVASLLVQQASSLYLLNRFGESQRAAEEAVEAARALGDPTALARAEITRARTVLWARGPNASRLAARRALDVLGPHGDPELRAIAHADLARALGELTTVGSVAEGCEEAVAEAGEALALAQELGRADLEGYALMYLGCERLALGDEAGAEDLDSAIRALRCFPRTELAVRACVNASGAAYRAARFDEAERYVEVGLQLGKDAEFASGEYRLALTRASVRFSRGRWLQARRELEALVGQGGEPGIMGPLARSVLARLVARQGEHAAAATVLEPALDAAAGSDEVRLVGPVTIARVELAWLAGRGDDLVHLAEPVLAAPWMPGSVVSRAELCRYLQRAGHAVAGPAGAPEPWRTGLAGDWRTAAGLWAARDEPYEQALELVSGDDRSAADAGITILRTLDATGAVEAASRPAPRC